MEKYEDIKEIEGYPKIPLGRCKDLRGQKFNKLLPLYRTENKGKDVMWVCQCDCGNITSIRGQNITNNHTKSCGCVYNERYSNLIGQKFGWLTVIEKSAKKDQSATWWVCKCNCGNVVEVAQKHLKNGDTKSCGCYKRLNSSKNNLKDLTGQTFGYLTVIERATDIGILPVKWRCKCNGPCGGTVIDVIGDNLVRGHTQSCGCLRSKGQIKISQLLRQNNILFETEKTFQTLKSNKKGNLRFDFYLPDYNCLIEYDGEQHYHYRENSGWNNKENFEYTILNDSIKNQWCKDNGLLLIRIPYTHFNKLNINDLLPRTSKYILKEYD